jgi:transcriptional regulator with XRE-family HTH domain
VLTVDVARIQTWSKERGWSQTDLAKRAELNKDSMSEIWRGKSMPRMATLERLAKAFGMTPAELLDGVNGSRLDHASVGRESLKRSDGHNGRVVAHTPIRRYRPSS